VGSSGVNMQIDINKIDLAVNALHKEIKSLDVRDSLSEYIEGMLEGSDYDDALETIMVSLVHTVLNTMEVKE
jgi:hypothetical protein